MKVEVKFGSKTLQIDVSDDPSTTLADLRLAIAAATSVPPPLQKLMGKPNTKDDTKTLAEIGIKDGTKLMLIGSTAKEVVATHTESNAKEEARTKRIKNLGDLFWRLPAFGGVLADPYVAGKGRPVEGASAAEALMVLDAVLSRINPVGGNATLLQTVVGGGAAGASTTAASQVSHVLLPNWCLTHRKALVKAHMVVRKATELVTLLAAVQSSEAVPEAVGAVIAAVRGCGDGEYVLIPSGWIGQTSHTIAYLLVAPTKGGGDTFSLVVVNRAASEYHPHCPTADKIKTQPCLRIDRIERSKMLDEAFWLVTLSLWLRANDPQNLSEYCRTEVLYDCLLPWLCEMDGGGGGGGGSGSRPLRSLTESIHHDPVSYMPNLALSEEEQERQRLIGSEGKYASIARSESSATKGLISAFCYLMQSFVASDTTAPAESTAPSSVAAMTKQLKLAIKYEFYKRGAEDLVAVGQRHLIAAAAATKALAAATTPAATSASESAAVVAAPLFSSKKQQGGRATAATTRAIQSAVDAVLATGCDPKQGAVTLQLLFDQVTTRDFIKTRTNHIIHNPAQHFQGRYVLLYFSASWCGPCKKIAPLLVECYEQLTQRLPKHNGTDGGPAVECILASCDKTLADFDQYAAQFPFLRMTWPCQGVFEAFDVKGIPTLLLFSPSGSLMTAQGVQALLQDPEGSEFPHGVWSGLAPLNETDVAVWSHASQVLAHAALKRLDRDPHEVLNTNSSCTGTLSPSLFRNIHDLIAATEGLVSALPSNARPVTGREDGEARDASAVVVDDALTAAIAGPSSIGTAASPSARTDDAATTAALESFPNGSLLPNVSKAQYYGKMFKPVIPELGDISQFVPPTTMAALIDTLIDARCFVDTLWARAKNSGTSSRVAVQMHVIEFISWLFTHIVPVPTPATLSGGGGASGPAADADEAVAAPPFVSDVFHAPFPEDASTALRGFTRRNSGTSVDAQMIALRQVYFLQLSYCTAWQAVETPARSYDAERCVISMCMLIVYDALARNVHNAKEVFLLAFLLNDDGGCYLSTTLSKANRSFEDVSARLELVKPKLVCIRSALIGYIRRQRSTLRRELFDLRQTDKLELRKHSYTVDFMRRFLENCGYEIFARQSGGMSVNQSEMEKLMMWFCDARAPVAREHPEFTMLRDMVLLTKFLGTMELRDAQLLRKKKELDEFATWRLAFEEDTPGRQMSAGWRTKPDPPRWECLMVRGRDMDIADIGVKGFGDRDLLYGEGLALQSPVDVGAVLNMEQPTEDDILHAATLPSFGGTLTIEESEMVLSILTVPYLRIPMMLHFFANNDRHSYLFTQELQQLLRAALFEPGVHLHPDDVLLGGPSSAQDGGGVRAGGGFAEPTEVPLRLTRQQRTEVQIAIIKGDTSRRDGTTLLGTTNGLLLNELAKSPHSVFEPLLLLLRTVASLGPSSVYSLNTTYVLFLLQLATDVVTYALFALSHTYALRQAAPSAAASVASPTTGCGIATVHPVLSQPSVVEDFVDNVLSVLERLVVPLLHQWNAEAEENEDTPTLCVLESYHASLLKAKLNRSVSVASGGGGTSGRSNVSATASTATAIVALLSACAYVRARHGFGMGMQRTQLAAAANESILSPEEKLMRFLQAQGLDTTRVTKEMLDHGRRLMQSGGRRRAVFVQIRSRFYSDTVRVPNLFRSDATSATESKRLKLPPVDVPEHLIFSILLEEHACLTEYLLRMHQQQQTGAVVGSLDRIMGQVVQRVLREGCGGGHSTGGSHPTARADAWLLQGGSTSGGPTSPSPFSKPMVFVAPASGLAFHLQTCELFWRNDELKPVPDSMSHFSDYETILGKDILQCGLVRRTEHRHWVHIVGTPYDVIEWSTTDPDDQGVHQPRILVGPPAAETVEQVKFEGLIFDRPVNVDDDTPWPVKHERWAIDLVKTVLKEAYPMPQEMKYQPIALSTQDATTASALGPITTTKRCFRLVMNDKPQYEKEEERNTWKEIVVHADPLHLQLFNLVPHARCVYRSLVFSSDQRLALHSLPLLKKPRDARSLDALRYQAGELKKRVQNESSLEVWRFNARIHGREVYVPARLLQGVVPSALLESFLFWHGEDDVMRGYPMHDEDDTGDANTAAGDDNGGRGALAAATSRAATLHHWFSYAVEVRFGPVAAGGGCTITRRNDMAYASAASTTDGAPSPAGGSAAVDEASGMRRSVSFDDQHLDAQLAVPDASVAMLRSIYPTLPPRVLRYALRAASLNISDAIEWISQPENESTITGLIDEGGSPMRRRPSGGSGGGSPLSPKGGSTGRSSTRSRVPPSTDADADSLSAAKKSDSMLLGVNPAVKEGDELETVSTVPLQLLHLGHSVTGQSMRAILDAFAAVEDASHTLVWGTRAPHAANSANNEEAATCSSGGVCHIHTIELPRLRAKFQPRQVMEDIPQDRRRHAPVAAKGGGDDAGSSGTLGEWRLFLLDHPGWMVATPSDVRGRRGQALKRLAEPFPQHLILRNTTDEYALFVPNHDFAPLLVRGNPFGAQLLFDRSSLQWQESVPSPFYLYHVHPSKAFVVPPSLGASLYAAALLCMHRRYEGAMRTLEACYVDTAFTVEEAFMSALMERTLDRNAPDLHPDAHAVRLKLAHAVMYSENKLGWPLHVELDAYLHKVRHVSANCRLQREELLDLLKRCSRAPPLVKTQLELWVPFLQQGQTDVRVGANPHLLRIGQPWDKLMSMHHEVIAKRTIRRVHYQGPKQPLTGKLAADLLWDDELLVDEESGANRQLGFFFLYQIKRSRIPIVLVDPSSSAAAPGGGNIAKSLGEILTRYFHLRHCRWGREAQETGEGEAVPSFAMCVLGAMDAFPDAAWPDMTDRATLAAMTRGLNTTGEEAEQRTKLPVMMRSIESLMRTLYRTSMGRLQGVRRGLQAAHQPFQERKCLVRMHDYVVARVLPSDSAADRVAITASHCRLDDAKNNGTESGLQLLQHLSTMPLDAIGVCAGYVTQRPRTDGHPNEAVMPFDIASHPWAATHVARDMLQRMATDLATYASAMNQNVSNVLAALTPETVTEVVAALSRPSTSTANNATITSAISNAVAVLVQLMDALTALVAADEAAVHHHCSQMLSMANGVPTVGSASFSASSATATPSSDALALMRFRMQRVRKDKEPVGVEWLCGGLLSTQLAAEMHRINPYHHHHGHVEGLRAHTALMMLRSNRCAFATQALAAARTLHALLVQGVAPLLHQQQLSQQDYDGTEAQWYNSSVVLDGLRKLGVEWTPADDAPSAGNHHGGAAAEKAAGVASAVGSRIRQQTGALIDVLTSQRHYATFGATQEPQPASPHQGAEAAGSERGSTRASVDDQPTMALDPRFLLFEFLFNFLLRKRQVEMVRWFASNVRQGVSRVQQMLMGQGKTTVVGPLLALMMADGAQLVTQVMPTALLEQSRIVLRRCFSTIVPKRILSLQFDRSCEDSVDVAEALFQKLDSAKRMRAIVVSAPECIKALFLKYVEELHAMETVSSEDLDATSGGAAAGVDERRVQEVQRLRAKVVARSNMADGLVPILDLWRQGVLIMDEVDVLLHPLRSELNFPIGLKYPIDLSGARWYLPMHLLSAMFPLNATSDATSLSSPPQGARSASGLLYGLPGPSTSAETVALAQGMQTVHAAIQTLLADGVRCKALQREPHLVLLDTGAYYHDRLLPQLVPWAALWLHHAILSDRAQYDGRTPHSTTSIMGSNEALPFDAATTSLEAFTAHVTPFLTVGSQHLPSLAPSMDGVFSPSEMQLLFLAREWLITVMPHVLSKIDRVGYGMLQPGDVAPEAAAALEATAPLSRKLMAIPFVAKDVPSRSSEFAHPDVVIGLTILAYRYEGLRLSDTKALLKQLKHDHSRQSGASEQRPAAVLYASWVSAAAAATTSTTTAPVTYIPLAQLHVQDPAHVHALHTALRSVPTVMHYYLSHHVFPRTMNFQQLKLSACGHELGSSILFQRRVGFSGTPSNLLPLDLGDCSYEPGSDGHMLSVLTNPAITTCELLPDAWNPMLLLQRIAEANPPYHALIDTGALITNMDNEQVARCLLAYLPPALFEGVVFLDRGDRQVVLLRSNEAIVPVSQCGIALSRRFTFFDQVHTTGMDIKQAATATAVVTLGKDLVFRDYAQGSYRMRGIGKGQRIRVYVIPEVQARIAEVLGPQRTSGRLEVDVPAWLLLNAMRMEGLQFVKLCQQELMNVWRKRALLVLRASTTTTTTSTISTHGQTTAAASQHHRMPTEYERSRRFAQPLRRAAATTPITTAEAQCALLCHAIAEFREAIAFPLPTSIESPTAFHMRLQQQMDAKPPVLLRVEVQEPGDVGRSATNTTPLHADEEQAVLVGSQSATAANQRIAMVMDRMRGSSEGAPPPSHHEAGVDDPDKAVGLSAEVVHEQEAEEEQEQEAEQEEQRVSHFSRDDEEHIPWRIDVLKRRGCASNGSDDSSMLWTATHGSPFFHVNGFQMRPEQPLLQVESPTMLVSDNFFRARWRGVGERRLKNCMLFVEWLLPAQSSNHGGSLNSQGQHDADQNALPKRERVYGLLTLAEGESVRWYMHYSTTLNATIPVALNLVGGRNDDNISGASPRPSWLDASDLMHTIAPSGAKPQLAAGLFYRYLNNDMFYTPEELTTLHSVLGATPPAVRLAVFLDCFRGRRRPNNEWEDTPIATLFADDAAQSTLRARATLRTLARTLHQASASKRAQVQANWLDMYRKAIVAATTKTAVPLASLDAVRRVEDIAPGAAVHVGLAAHALHGSLTLTLARQSAGAAFTVDAIAGALVVGITDAQGPTDAPRADGSAEDSAAPPNATTSSSATIATWASLVEALPSLSPHNVLRCAQCGRACYCIGGVSAATSTPAPSTCKHCNRPMVDAPPPACASATGADANNADAPGGSREDDQYWQCSVCTLINEPQTTTCSACGTANPASTSLPKGNVAEERRGASPSPWACAVCTLVNSANVPLCVACNTPNPHHTPTSGTPTSGAMDMADWRCPEGHWTCSIEQGGCSKFNPNSTYYCQVCDRARPNLASLRF